MPIELDKRERVGELVGRNEMRVGPDGYAGAIKGPSTDFPDCSRHGMPRQGSQEALSQS